jgi:hypothetical protein
MPETPLTGFGHRFLTANYRIRHNGNSGFSEFLPVLFCLPNHLKTKR